MIETVLPQNPAVNRSRSQGAPSGRPDQLLRGAGTGGGISAETRPRIAPTGFPRSWSAGLGRAGTRFSGGQRSTGTHGAAGASTAHPHRAAGPSAIVGAGLGVAQAASPVAAGARGAPGGWVFGWPHQLASSAGVTGWVPDGWGRWCGWWLGYPALVGWVRTVRH